jgi:hypothetical protein
MKKRAPEHAPIILNMNRLRIPTATKPLCATSIDSKMFNAAILSATFNFEKQFNFFYLLNTDRTVQVKSKATTKTI